MSLDTTTFRRQVEIFTDLFLSLSLNSLFPLSSAAYSLSTVLAPSARRTAQLQKILKLFGQSTSSDAMELTRGLVDS